MEMFIEADGMRGGRAERGGPGDSGIFFMIARQTHTAQDVPGAALTLEIIKGLYRKEYAVYPEKQGIKEYSMEPFFHGHKSNHKKFAGLGRFQTLTPN